MLELGESGPALHREIGRHLLAVDARTQIDHGIFVGELSGFAALEVGRKWPSPRITRLAGVDRESSLIVGRLIHPGDAVLIKGSRGMGLERLVPVLDRAGAQAPARAKPQAATVSVPHPESKM
jgi:UDP-N-acetylmuramoyl-tripeptide--D-alanyl-D-alanine ligase